MLIAQSPAAPFYNGFTDIEQHRKATYSWSICCSFAYVPIEMAPVGSSARGRVFALLAHRTCAVWLCGSLCALREALLLERSCHAASQACAVAYTRRSHGSNRALPRLFLTFRTLLRIYRRRKCFCFGCAASAFAMDIRTTPTTTRKTRLEMFCVVGQQCFRCSLFIHTQTHHLLTARPRRNINSGPCGFSHTVRRSASCCAVVFVPCRAVPCCIVL